MGNFSQLLIGSVGSLLFSCVIALKEVEVSTAQGGRTRLLRNCYMDVEKNGPVTEANLQVQETINP